MTRADIITVIVVAIISAIVFGILSDYNPGAIAGVVILCCIFIIACQSATESSKKAESEQAIRLLASIYKYRDIVIDYYRDIVIDYGDPYWDARYPMLDYKTLDYKAKQMYFEKHRNLNDEYYDKVISARQEFDHYLSAYGPLQDQPLQAARKSDMQLISKEMSKIEYAIRDRIRNELIIINPDETPDKKQKAEQFLKDMELGFSAKFNELVEKAEKCLRPRILS